MTKNRDKIVNRDITKNITPYRSPLATSPPVHDCALVTPFHLRGSVHATDLWYFHNN